MSIDWIKMRTDLQSHPKIVRILSATGTDKFRVIGGLHAVWSVFDTHSVDGILKGYTPELMDHVIGWQGFSRAMEAVGWMVFDGLETLVLPEFDTHNGQSAKRRAEDQKRKRNERNRPQSVRNLSAEGADKKRTREDKNREEEKTLVTFVPSAPKNGKPESETLEAIAAFNDSLAAPAGLLAKVSTRVGLANRTRQVARSQRLAREICREQYGADDQPGRFWRDYFAACAGDEFLSGRKGGGAGHENWRPDFEYLTNPKTILKVYDRTAGVAA